MAQLQALGSMLGRAARRAAGSGAAFDSICSQLSHTTDSTAIPCSRLFSSHAGPRSSSNSSALRRVNLSGSSNTAAAGDAAAADAASTAGQGSSSSFIEMSKEVPGGAKPLRTWEKWYWGLGVVGISLILYKNLKKPDKTPEEIEAAAKKAAELEQRRKEHLRAVLIGQNFIEGDDDPLEGLSPYYIVKFMEVHGIDETDPLEGLTPEEIDAYVRKQEAKRQQQQDGEQ